MGFKLRTIKKPTEKELRDIIDLYKEAGWLEPWDDKKRISSIIKKSYLFVCVSYKGKIIAMARVISDGVNDAYIQDLFVSCQFRKRRVGSSILSYIKDYLLKKGFKWISLIAEKGTYDFYKKNGFRYIKEMKFFKYEFRKTQNR